MTAKFNYDQDLNRTDPFLEDKGEESFNFYTFLIAANTSIQNNKILY